MVIAIGHFWFRFALEKIRLAPARARKAKSKGSRSAKNGYFSVMLAGLIFFRERWCSTMLTYGAKTIPNGYFKKIVRYPIKIIEPHR
jgi:hypothetical protein